MSRDIVQSDRFLASVRSWHERDPAGVAALVDTIAQLVDGEGATDRGVEILADNGEEQRLVTRVGQENLALAWARVADTVVPLLFGRYDEVRDTARHLRFVIDETGGVRLHDERYPMAHDEQHAPSVIPSADHDVARRLGQHVSRQHFAPTTIEELRGIMAAPIEDWMVFLHPDQAALVDRSFAGPARVRGAAGTGKTVVALHRARHLARERGGKILFTTYVANLPRVFARLFARFAPEWRRQVEFLHVHAWANRYLRAKRVPFRLDGDGMYQAYNEAYRRIVRHHPDLDAYGWRYLREEIDWVIKGRGLRQLEDYLALARTGRGTPLARGMREQVWSLVEEYDAQLRRRGIIDFGDLLTRALEHVREAGEGSPYRAVIVDEVQDLTEIALRLTYELAGRDRADGLFLVGDGQQAVYPGGFALAHIGIDVRGRSTHLRVNYRNTQQIVGAARRVVGATFDDGDEQPSEAAAVDDVVLRTGARPRIGGHETLHAHDRAVVEDVTRACERPDVRPGDVAVLVPTNALVRHYVQLFTASSTATQPLDRYDGRSNERVKVGTYQRAKGLEFKHVVLARLDPEGLDEDVRHGEDPASHAERIDLLRRQLFVAMTRARDQLVGHWWRHPSVLLDGALDDPDGVEK